jgi:S1-C subfamily serine protease
MPFLSAFDAAQYTLKSRLSDYRARWAGRVWHGDGGPVMQKEKSMKRRTTIALAAIFLVGGLLGSWATARTGHSPFGRVGHVAMFVSNSTAGAIGKQVSFINGFTPIVTNVLPAVVNIAFTKVGRTDQSQAAPFFSDPFFSDPFFRQFFGGDCLPQMRMPQQEREHSLGSGVIVKPDGYVLTNYHVVEGAQEISVSLGNKQDYRGKVVGTGPKTDIAVVKIDAKDLPVLTLGDSSKVNVGDFALAVGNPFGIGQTVTMGIISATGRRDLGIEDPDARLTLFTVRRIKT